MKPVIVKVTVDSEANTASFDTTQSDTVRVVFMAFHVSDGLTQLVPAVIVGDVTEKPEGTVMTKYPV